MNLISVLKDLCQILILVLNVVHVTERAHGFWYIDFVLHDRVIMDGNSPVIAIFYDPIVDVPNLKSQLKLYFTVVKYDQVFFIDKILI